MSVSWSKVFGLNKGAFFFLRARFLGILRNSSGNFMGIPTRRRVFFLMVIVEDLNPSAVFTSTLNCRGGGGFFSFDLGIVALVPVKKGLGFDCVAAGTLYLRCLPDLTSLSTSGSGFPL